MTHLLHMHVGVDWPARDDDPDVPCCMGSAVAGPGGCTCWEPVHDLDQADPDPDAGDVFQPQMCAGCAFRPGSPERTSDPTASADAEDLEQLVTTGTPFWCHQGLRRIVAHRHPDGRERTDGCSDASYDPPVVDGVPYAADGTPALLCAGWAHRRLKEIS